MELSRFFFVSDSIYKSLKKDEIDYLKKAILQKTYSKNRIIFSEGSFPKGVFILDKGKVKIFQKTFEGAEQIMNIHIDEEVFGYRPVLCEQKYPVSASAIEECKISFIPKKEFMFLLKKSPVLSNTLLRFLSYEFTVWVNTITNFAQRTVKERLLLNLLILSEKYRTKKKWPIEITLSRADLAALVGTSNETLARMIKKLKDDKYIVTRGRKIIISGPAQTERIEKSIWDI
jgi:CRP-like cAMP-binding protein